MVERTCFICGLTYHGLVIPGQPAWCPTCHAAQRSIGWPLRAAMGLAVLAVIALGGWAGGVIIGQGWGGLVGCLVLGIPFGMLMSWLQRRMVRAALARQREQTKIDAKRDTD